MDLRLIPAGIAALALLTACGGGTDATESTMASSAAASSASASATAPDSTAAGLAAANAAACDEVNRLTREAVQGITDPDTGHWEAFAVGVQNVANGSPDPAMREALTTLATAALTASEKLADGGNVRDSTAGFLDAVPAVDSLCKVAGQPLN